MKKIYTLAGAAMLSATLSAQVSFTDDFEAYNVGDYIGTVSPDWTTWSGVTGGTEDAQVTTANASSGTQAIYFSSTSATGGPQDVVLPFQGPHSLGTFVYEMDMFVETNKGGYFNFQANNTLGQLWALEVYMNQSGQMFLQNNDAMFLQTTFPQNTWFTIRFDINLNTNNWELFINNVSQGAFSNTVNQVASIDLYPVNATTPHAGNNQAGFYVDDVMYSHTPYTLPLVNGAVTAVGTLNPASRSPVAATGLVGQNRKFAATVRNLGQNPITSFDISYNYNSATINQTVSSVNIASLASYSFEFNTPATLITGTNPLVVTISNVNGAGADGDAADNARTGNVAITTVPAPGKVVFGEEATGTWCQWCPRGAVYMDYMENSYQGYWAGAAVHNGDPMVVTAYDAAIGPLIGGYPSQLVDRTPYIDPSGVEAAFMTQVQQAPTATIMNGAQYNASTGQLDVSLTYTFAMAANSSYKVACILTEDGVTGTNTQYNQSNAYAGGSNGQMGGFETLPGSVSYTVMVYDHVARAISPSFAGGTGLPTTVNPGYVQTFNFSFTVPSTWDTANLHIIGILIDPTGDVDNAGIATFSEAIANGYVTDVNSPVQPQFAVTVFPNPSEGNTQMQVELSRPEEVVMTITDITGKVVAQRNYGELNGMNVLPIETSTLAEGVYMVEVRTGTTVNTTKLVIRQH